MKQTGREVLFLKYIVGYPVSENQSFVNSIIQHKEHISEVYFSWGDFPNGRSSLNAGQGLTSFELQQRQFRDLKTLSNAGMRFNLLFNANCYGKDSQSRAFFDKIGTVTDFLQNELKLSSVTTSSPLIAKFMKNNFEGIDVRASVNMEIGSIEGLSYVLQYFDSFYVKRELNRNLEALLRLRRFCDDKSKEMYLLANSGCLNFCSAHTFHDNLVAHEAEIAGMDNGYQFKGVCWEYLSDPQNFYTWLSRTNFIRPEDISLYESITPAMKLATRVNTAPGRVLDAYVERHYRGSVMELLEPNHSGLFYPSYVENTKFKEGFAEKVMNCDKHCETCGYCANVMNDACIKLSNDPTLKV